MYQVGQVHRSGINRDKGLTSILSSIVSIKIYQDKKRRLKQGQTAKAQTITGGKHYEKRNGKNQGSDDRKKNTR